MAHERLPALRGHMPTLDGLRGIAILAVLVSHFVHLAPTAGDLPAQILGRTARLGWAGVDLFFVLSGFLITGILIEARRDDGFFRTFYMRRTVRIFPLYYVFLLGAFVVAPRTPVGALAPAEAWPWFVSYGTNILVSWRGSFAVAGDMGHLWSLAVEEQFYLLWPLVVYALSPRALERAAIGLVVGALVLRLGVVVTGASPIAMFALLPMRMDALGVGAWLACRLRRPVAPAAMARVARVAGCAAAMAFVLIAARAGSDLRFQHPLGAAFGYSLLAIASAALLATALVAREGSLLYRVLTARGLLQFGKYSYGLYVLHSLAPRVLAGFGIHTEGLPMVGGSHAPAALAYALLATGVAYALALISWRVLEQPMLRLKRLFPYASGTAVGAPTRQVPAFARMTPSDRRPRLTDPAAATGGARS